MDKKISIREMTGRLFAVIFFSLFAALFFGSVTALAADPVLDVRAFPVAEKGLPVQAGGDVTYFYQIENKGDNPVNNINITDDKCSQVTYDAVNQDANVDHKLDKGETWSYYCRSVAAATTTNTVNVSGDLDGAPVNARTTTTLTVPVGGSAGSTGSGGSAVGSGGAGGNGGIVFYDPAGGSGSNIIPNGMPDTGGGTAHKARSKHGNASQKASRNTKTLQIPSIGVDAKIEPVGLTAKRNMSVPANDKNVGLYQFGSHPGESGNAVIAGHLDTYTSSKGVFRNLDKLQTGDDVYVLDGQNTTMHFKVNQSEVYDADSAPLQSIFGASDKARLNLITCTGAWDNKLHQYSHRLVVFTDLVQ